MAKRKLSNEQVSRRIRELNKQYTLKQLAKKFGVSVSTIQRWKSGKSKPRTDTQYKKVNRAYNKYISPETKKKQKSKAKPTRQEIPIYPDYIYRIEKEFDIGNIETLEGLAERGFRAVYMGDSKHVPLEVVFLIHGDSLSRWGNTMYIIGIVGGNYPRGQSWKDSGALQYLRIYKIPKEILKYSIHIKKDDDLESRQAKLREYFAENINKLFHYKYMPIAYLGYYFAEDDEI